MTRKAITVLVAAGLVGACSGGTQPPAAPDTISVPVQVSSGSASTSANPASRHHHTHMNGAQEVPARDTLAQGETTFRISPDGQSISYRLNVANIENVLQSHIHLRVGGNATGGIVVWLYPSAPPAQLIEGRFQGVLAEGEFTAANLMGALAGQPLSALIDEMRAGNTYVNVHTTQFPPGEIRGDIQ